MGLQQKRIAPVWKSGSLNKFQKELNFPSKATNFVDGMFRKEPILKELLYVICHFDVIASC